MKSLLKNLYHNIFKTKPQFTGDDPKRINFISVQDDSSLKTQQTGEVIDAVKFFENITKDPTIKEFVKLGNAVDLRMAKLRELISVTQVEMSSNSFIKRLIGSSFSRTGIDCLKDDIEKVIQYLNDNDIKTTVGEWYNEKLYQRDLDFVTAISNKINKAR